MLLFNSLPRAAAAALLIVTLFSSSCRAMRRNDGVSSSGAAASSGLDVPVWGSLNDLSVERIQAGISDWQKYPGVHADQDTPMWEGTLLYHHPVGVDKVERALRLYGSVGLFDPVSGRLTKITYNPRVDPQLSSMYLEEPIKTQVIRVLETKLRIHRPFKQFRNWNLGMNANPDLLPPLPHAFSVPILRSRTEMRPGTDSELHMLTAFVGPHEFWHVGSDGQITHARAGRSLFLRPPEVWEERYIRDHLEQHDNAVNTFGPAVASLKYGQPIHAMRSYRDNRLQGIRGESPVISDVSNRNDMIDLLQSNGKFKFKASDGHTYKVFVTNPDVYDQRFQVEIKKSDGIGKAVGNVVSKIRKLRFG